MSGAITTRHWAVVASLGLALWLLSIVLVSAASDQFTVAFRVAASVSVLGIAVLTIWRGPRRLILSPLLHMSLLFLVFYAWFPWISDRLINQTTSSSSNHDLVAQYVGSKSELLVLGFVVLCASAHAAVAAITGVLISRGVQRRNHLPAAVGSWAVAVLSALSATLIARYLSPFLQNLTELGLGKELLGAAPVIMSLLAACTIAAWYQESVTRLISSAAIIVIAALLLLLSNQAPVPLLIMYGTVLLYMSLTQLSLARCVTILLALGPGVFVVTILVLMALRPPLANVEYNRDRERIADGFPGLLDRVSWILESKLFHRQGISAGCFHFIASRSLDAHTTGNPFYFAVAVVPRVVWPAKPDLSRGSEFAELCGQTGAYENRHSESITIIGEPVLEAGMLGLIVAELTLVALLIVVSVVGLAGGPVPLVALTALFPWMLPVEHPFALYVGNFFKMALVVLPFCFLLARGVRLLGSSLQSEKSEHQIQAMRSSN